MARFLLTCMDTDMDVATRNKKVKSVSIMLMDMDTDVDTRKKGVKSVSIMDMDTDTDVDTRKKKVKGASIMLMDMDMDTMAEMPALTGITGMAMGPTNVQRPSPTLVAVLEYNAFPGLSFCASCSLHVN